MVILQSRLFLRFQIPLNCLKLPSSESGYCPEQFVRIFVIVVIQAGIAKVHVYQHVVWLQAVCFQRGIQCSGIISFVDEPIV